MLHNKFFKIICMMSAVIIAFSSFSVSAVKVDNFFDITQFDFSGYYLVRDENNNVIDEIWITPDIIDYNKEKGKLYIDCKSSESSVLVKKGYRIDLYFSYDRGEKYDALENSYIFFNMPNGLKYRNSEVCYLYGGGIGEFYNKDNIYYHRVNNCPEAFIGFVADRTFYNFSFVAEVSSNVDDVDSYLGTVKTSPGKFKFFSDMGTFFKSSVNWFVDIFRKVSSVPALTVLVIGVVITGFSFGLLRKFVS